MEDTVPDLRASPRRNSAALKPMLGKKSIKKRLANWVSTKQKKTNTHTQKHETHAWERVHQEETC